MQASREIGRHSIRYGDETIVFALTRPASRPVARVAIHVEPDGRVLVEAPANASLEAVLAAIKKRARWISRHVAAARARMAHVLPREYVSGESLLYLGRRYRLKVLLQEDAKPAARMQAGFIMVATPRQSPELIRATLDAWLRQRAREVFAERLEAVAASLHWVKQAPPLRLQFMRVQWGSCSPAGRITLNPMLVKAPRECIDYVLLHELCHLRHHNHSPKFYRTLERHMPHWRAIKQKLDNLAEQVFRI